MWFILLGFLFLFITYQTASASVAVVTCGGWCTSYFCELNHFETQATIIQTHESCVFTEVIEGWVHFLYVEKLHFVTETNNSSTLSKVHQNAVNHQENAEYVVLFYSVYEEPWDQKFSLLNWWWHKGD